MNEKNVKQKASLLSLIQYGIIAFPLSFAGLPIYLHAPDFYAITMNIPVERIGISLLFLRLLDAIQDPFIGSASDKLHKHRPIIATIGMIMMTGGLWMIFHPVPSTPLMWLGLSIIICTTGFSIVSINVQAMGGIWDISKPDITKTMATREAFGMLGLLAASITPAILIETFAREHAFHLFSIGFIPLALLTLLMFLKWTKKAKLSQNKNKNTYAFKNVFDGIETKMFLSGYLLSSIAVAIPGTLIIFYVRDYLQAEQYLGLFLLAYFLSGALAMPLWNKLSRLTSNISAWWFSMILACITFVWAYFLMPNAIIGYAIICVLSGASIGANLALPSAIASNLINEKTHQHMTSRYYAVMALITKGSLALATGIALPTLGLLGYQPGQITETKLLPFTYAVIPCVFQLGAITTIGILLKSKKKHAI